MRRIRVGDQAAGAVIMRGALLVDRGQIGKRLIGAWRRLAAVLSECALLALALFVVLTGKKIDRAPLPFSRVDAVSNLRTGAQRQGYD